MSSSKKISGYIDLTIPAGKATPQPPIGSALGQRGVNIMEFCKAFNAKTAEMDPGTPVPTKITVYVDKSFTFITKTPPASYFLKKYADISKGSGAAKKDKAVGAVTVEQCREIAKIKLPDLNAYDIEAATRIIIGSAGSMGIDVVK